MKRIFFECGKVEGGILQCSRVFVRRVGEADNGGAHHVFGICCE